MSRIDHLLEAWQFNRVRTLGLLDKLEQETDPAQSLPWQPGPGRAHIAWQLMHIGITEELFATERLRPEKATKIPDLLPRYKVGSTPDQNIPTPAEIRATLAATRENLLDTMRTFDDSQLDWISPALTQRQLSLLGVLHILAWHEGHHQGQAHITLNLFLAAKGA